MIQRCERPKARGYSNYGGRGITVCERWHTYENFLADMGERPSRSLQLDRINNDGNYEPTNCRWATPREQLNNTRFNHRIEFNGRIQTLTQWSIEIGIALSTLGSRLKKAWSVERALTEPRHAEKSRQSHVELV